ncbi:hypothetical protein N7E81_01560 [Reichenbachiella carrageenanivorans]|uniref:DNA primase/helicase n=1 Tax=Reichenbachiella carrageenanivorans TaxID=2979869 RepID=A0ABY6D103_9BACT|nr:hypothetical protein [Reichenbachiella carrageenanivorans]UXX79793.1 hypothetical protein N7E81_01560 [Reichenbachiella carrageenanivorans]
MDNLNLDTTNPENITFQYTVLDIHVLGGIRTDYLDRMRVTLKTAVAETVIPPVRHNLDLYNSTQVEKFVRLIAEKLEIGTSVIAGALHELTNLLETYRLEIREKEREQPEQRKMLSPEEIKKYKLYLSSPNLMKRTNEDLGKCGIIGEENNRLLMFLIFLSRKMSNPLHIISLGSSGVGKTHLQERVGALVPDEDKLEITTLSGNAFYYFGQHQLRNKLILIEDLDGAEEVLYPLREIKSKKKITKTVVIKNTKGETKTVTLTVEGPVCVSGCTTKESLYEDNANRSFLIYIDESREQDEKIMDHQRAVAAGKVDRMAEQQMIEQFQDMQRVLQPVTIRNPYAQKLKIPTEVFKPRRTNAHYLAFIEAVTFYYQMQREKQYDKETGEEYIETTLEDIHEANILMKEILLRKSDDLTGACRSYFETLKTWLKEKKGQKTFTNSQISLAFRTPLSTIKRYNLQLKESGYLKSTGLKNKGYHYEIVSYEEYEQLKSRIGAVLDQIVEKLQKKKAA